MKVYKTKTKSDDYGACITEFVRTTAENAKEYYSHIEIEEKDVEIIEKYFDVLDYEEEKERSNDRRFYGNE